MTNQTVLLIDDDGATRRQIVQTLYPAGYAVVATNNGQDGLRAFHLHTPDLVIADILLPDISGWTVCRQIRILANTPIIILAAEAAPRQPVKALRLGADDYLTKPFHPAELQARIQAVLRRARPPLGAKPGKLIHLDRGRVTINPHQQRVYLKGEPLILTATETRLLLFLAAHPNQILPPSLIFDRVWPYDSRADFTSVKWYIWRLRRKIETDPKNPTIITTERGLGYRFCCL